jgi:hypothetical protein
MRPRTSGQSAIRRAVPAYYMIKVLLAVFIAMLRARPSVRPGDPGV